MLENLLKRTVVFLSLFCLIISINGCSEETEYDLNKISSSISSRTKFSPLKELSGTSLSSYFGFQDSDVKRFSVKVSATSESADTIACFEVKDKDGQDTVISGISQYLNSRSTSFKTTMENEYIKVQSRLLVQVDDIIILVVCNDYPAVAEYLDELGAKEVV